MADNKLKVTFHDCRKCPHKVINDWLWSGSFVIVVFYLLLYLGDFL